METPERILVIRLTAMGDVVLTLPAVFRLRQNFPRASITFLTTRENADLLRGFRGVDRVIAVDREVLRGKNLFRTLGELGRLIRKLRAGKFSLVVDFQANGESGWLTRLTGAPRRWGFAKKSSRRRAYTQSTGHFDLHAAASNCALLEHCGLPGDEFRNEFFLPPDALATAREFFAAHNLSTGRPTLFVQPFTSGAYKNWPLENYLAVARHWRAQGVQIILGGGPKDRAALEAARQEGFAVSAGAPLLVTGGLMQLSSLVLGGDTGALHLAVAQGKRVLMLMREVRPSSPIPFQHPTWVIPAPRPLMIAEIPIEQVNAAVADALSAPAGNVSG